MSRATEAMLVLRAMYELARFDVMNWLFGFGRLTRELAGQPVAAGHAAAETQGAVCGAVVLASCFYWKPVLCLQRSLCATRLLRAYGVPARLVIGCRPVPFLSHAWVEVDGRIVNDSPVYQRRLQVLYTV